MGVGIERHRGTVPELCCDLDDRKAALVDEQTREAVTEVIGASALKPVDPGRGLVGPSAPVPVIVVAPRSTVGSGKNQLALCRPTARELPLGKILS
jgi:hypothetical protein